MFAIHLLKKKKKAASCTGSFIYQQTNRSPMSPLPVYTGAYEQMPGPDAPT